MRTILQKWTSAALVLALLLSLLPPMQAQAAAASITITNLYTVTAANGQPTDLSSVTRLTNSPTTVVADISGIVDSQIPDIYYEITNTTTNAPTDVNKTNKAQKSGNAQITFRNVNLTPGLNRIVLKMGSSAGISSSAGWVYFTPITNITDLNVNGQTFTDGQMYPANPKSNTQLNITGKAFNAKNVQAMVAGDPDPKQGFFSPNGDFSFTADSVTKRGSSLANIFLNPGDNKLTFLATNDTNTFQAERSFIYDNGRPFAYSSKIAQWNGTAYGTPTAFTSQPQITNSKVQITSKFKVNLVSVSASTYTLEYPYMQVNVSSLTYPSPATPGNSGPAKFYDLSSYSINWTATPSPTVSGATYGNIQLNVAESKQNEYYVFDYQENVDPLSSIKKQIVKFNFTKSTATAPSAFDPNSTYSFDFVDSTLPYVQTVSRVMTSFANDPGIQLTELGTNEISEQPFQLRVLGNANTTDIKVVVGSTTFDSDGLAHTPIPGKEDPAAKVFVVNVQGLTNGAQTMTVYPYSGPSGSRVRNDSGGKTYNLNVTSAPYVILNNLYTGAIIKRGDPIDLCKCFSGRLVNVSNVSNVPPSEQELVEISFNDGLPQTLKSDPDTVRHSDTAIDTKGNFTFYYQNRSITLAQGRNVIKVYLYQKDSSGNKVLVTKSDFEIFYFDSDAPVFGSITPVPVVPADRVLFTPGKNADEYSTTEKAVRLRGNFVVDQTSAPSLKLTVRSKTKDGVPFSKSTTVDLSSPTPPPPATVTNNEPEVGEPPYLNNANVTLSNPTKHEWTFATIDPDGTLGNQGIALNPQGDTIFEFELTNSANVKVVKTITITREPVPYRFLNLNVIKNDKGEDQTNINSNFQDIHLEAEFADQVLFGKEVAVLTTDLLTNQKYYNYPAKNLRPGKNTIKFTVVRGTNKVNGTLVLNNLDTPLEGASYTAKLGSSMKVFDGGLELKFPKDTNLMRNDPTAANQFLTSDRSILFGIASSMDGRVDKSYAGSDPMAESYLSPPARFRRASNLYWIDTGTIDAAETDMEKALRGSGRLPYDGNLDKFYFRNPQDQVVPTQRGTLTLKYDPAIRNDAWRYVTVYHFDFYENSNGVVGPGWRNIGGVVDPKNNTITVPFDTPGYYQVMYMTRSFQDITNHAWARNELDTLFSKGLMLNKDAVAFQPNDFISRGEFTTLLVKIFDLPLDYQNGLSFDDVGLNKNMDPQADYKYIETAARAGIVRGITETQFMPNLSVTRQDAAVMIARAAELKLATDPEKSLAALTKTFTDAAGIDLYALPSVEAVTKAGLIEGKENVLGAGQTKATLRFDPLETFTRAEAAVVAMRVLQQQKKVPK